MSANIIYLPSWELVTNSAPFHTTPPSLPWQRSSGFAEVHVPTDSLPSLLGQYLLFLWVKIKVVWKCFHSIFSSQKWSHFEMFVCIHHSELNVALWYKSHLWSNTAPILSQSSSSPPPYSLHNYTFPTSAPDLGIIHCSCKHLHLNGFPCLS